MEAVAVPAGLAGITNPGYHGLTQVLYEYASSAANNGSGFEGLADNTYFWNITAGLVMFFGRYLSIIIILAIASSLMMKQPVSESIGTLRTDTRTFTISLLMVVLIIAALTFFPALILGLIAEHMILSRNILIYGLGGVAAPFVGIKLIDLVITPLLAVLGL